jgi:hypothetical protein
LLREGASKLLATVSESVALIPLPVCSLLKSIRSLVEKKIPSMTDKSITSLLFLRLLNPALCSPEVFLGAAELPAHVRRSLILLSKVMQNLANGVLFGDKESYLEFANEWLVTAKPQLASFIFDTVFAIRGVKTSKQIVVFLSYNHFSLPFRACLSRLRLRKTSWLLFAGFTTFSAPGKNKSFCLTDFWTTTSKLVQRQRNAKQPLCRRCDEQQTTSIICLKKKCQTTG